MCFLPPNVALGRVDADTGDEKVLKKILLKNTVVKVRQVDRKNTGIFGLKILNAQNASIYNENLKARTQIDLKNIDILKRTRLIKLREIII